MVVPACTQTSESTPPYGSELLAAKCLSRCGLRSLSNFRDQCFRGCLRLLVCLAFGFDVAELSVTGLYSQDHFHSHILFRHADHRPLQCCQLWRLWPLAQVHRPRSLGAAQGTIIQSAK